MQGKYDHVGLEDQRHRETRSEFGSASDVTKVGVGSCSAGRRSESQLNQIKAQGVNHEECTTVEAGRVEDLAIALCLGEG